MNFKSIITGALLLAASQTVVAQTEMTLSEDIMAEALMKAYNSLLAEDPHDYEALFRRASEYYRRDDYIKALADIDLALKYIPESEVDMRSEAYSLRANIQMMNHRYENALADLNSVLALNPGSFVTIYQRATALYNLGRYAEAKNDFKIMQQMNPRSQEALFGLARVAVKENNLGLANELIDNAVGLTPASSTVYMRRADVRTMMGNTQGAVEDYIMAISSDEANTPGALARLVDLSRKDYPVVVAGLTNSIRQAPRNGLFYYLRAMIAQGHCNYTAAIADYDKILNDGLESYPGINASLAECYYALGNYDAAEMNIDYAVGATSNNVDYYVLKSSIELALGNAENALSCAEKALEKDPNNNPALIAKAKAQIALKEYADASVALSEAAMNDPENPELFILRGWMLEKYRNNTKSAQSCFERVLDMDFDFDNVRSLRGFALLYLERQDEAVRWMNRILDTATDYDGMINYYGACLYAWVGNTDKAFKCMNTSLEKGYANFHNWTKADEANLNVAPLRGDKRFTELINKYSIIFK
ncbi:MAG: tetratricopeptide repeat protein [Lachnoclostridium sp.]|nr:tetratricopeptide repeat protein [Lachnoclostridium sp.]